MSDSRHMEFEDTTAITLGLMASLCLYVVVSEVGVWSSLLEVQLLLKAAAGSVIYDVEAAANEDRQAIVGGLYMLVWFVTSLLFVWWIYTTNRNAHALSDGMRSRPTWAVGWFFVPILNIWKPYQALKETYEASHPDYHDNWGAAPRPRALAVWWGLWIVTGVVMAAALAADVWSTANIGAVTVDHLLTSAWLDVAGAALAAPLGIAAILAVWRLRSWQSAKQKHGVVHHSAGPWPT